MSKSAGICVYCSKSFSKAGIGRHLSTHLKQQEKDHKISNNSAFHITVKANNYFLHLLMDGDSNLSKLDSFLRKIWLECCGHMSHFTITRWGDELSMKKKIRHLFKGGESFYYAYDFGSTTELDVKVLNRYAIKIDEPIVVMSRNEPLEIYCDACEKEPATQICPVHYDGEDMFFCDNCGEEHYDDCEDADYAMDNIYNSPRTGVCAYSGGSIDTQRDGVFQKSK